MFEGERIHRPFQNEKANRQDIDQISPHASPLLKLSGCCHDGLIAATDRVSSLP
jgi:hypothetical protein